MKYLNKHRLKQKEKPSEIKTYDDLVERCRETSLTVKCLNVKEIEGELVLKFQFGKSHFEMDLSNILPSLRTATNDKKLVLNNHRLKILRQTMPKYVDIEFNDEHYTELFSSPIKVVEKDLNLWSRVAVKHLNWE